MQDWWYQDAIIYSLDVEKFLDSNGNGVGDFKGLTGQLNYLAGLGVTCLWLLPFYPSPNRDNGYDVTDYYGVDPRLGSLGDFVEFMHQARERGIRVIIDLVVNHTSNQHPWFQAARRDKNSPYRDYYVWSETKPPNADEGVAFPGVQETIWTYDEKAGAYYLHHFYKHQPDLNIGNPAVRDEIRRIMGFWLELGVSGFRVDAAPFLITLRAVEDPDVSDPYEYLHEFRRFLSWRRGDAILLAEANVSTGKINQYFGNGDKMHMLFNFIVNQYLFLALARQQAAPLIEGLQKLPEIPRSGQWANFLRNHDELSLDRLSQAEREEVFRAFAPEERMQIYDRGIRRRVPPMLDGDLHRIKMAYSLMLTLPGAPVLRYGEEIGMGDDLSLDERNSVRTPMQWSNEKNAGFSTAPPDELILPVIDGGPYRYQKVNVIDERPDPASLLNWMERAVRTRKECPEFGRGSCRILEADHPAVFALCCTWQERTVIAVHNLAGKPCSFNLDLSQYDASHLVDLLGDRQYTAIEDYSRQIELEAYGFRWFRLTDRPI